MVWINSFNLVCFKNSHEREQSSSLDVKNFRHKKDEQTPALSLPRESFIIKNGGEIQRRVIKAAENPHAVVELIYL
jgi:hypothetical protein